MNEDRLSGLLIYCSRGGTFNIGKSWKSQEIPGHFPRPNVNKLLDTSDLTRQRWKRSFSMVSKQALLNDVKGVTLIEYSIGTTHTIHG